MPMAVSMAELPSPPLPFDATNQSEKFEQKRRLRDLLKLDRWRMRDSTKPLPQPKPIDPLQTPGRPALGRRLSRRGLVGIPRSTTFKRQEEEQRKNLTPVEPTIKERREVSRVRQRALSADPEPPRHARKERSVPENLRDAYPSIAERIDPNAFGRLGESQHEQLPPPPPPPPQSPPPDQESPQDDGDDEEGSEGSYDDAVDEEIMEELKKKWILNLSMHFRDKSPREKFFLTYAETPDRWRRVTVSCDYRDAPIDSLEHDLQSLHYQKDKSARIYESIRMSLPDIQFYDTVTNLKLETKDDRLHVHVTEDVNEIIPYPPIHLVNHLSCPRYRENDLHFDEHMSGFVYRVNVGENTWIKKEIPGPDSVDEFLYEVNALSELIGSKNVIQLKGLVIDNEGQSIKGLLLGYAEQGALIDILYDSKEGHIPHVSWERRERWAKQIIQGLSNIHEAGFVQGDFTLSNIVVNETDEAEIIDINRRGCPVGWESPEMVPLVESGQRLSMYIGVKSDLYQLGMVLWALAMEKDEPERAQRPLSSQGVPPIVPQYYRLLTEICLSSKPKQRFAAKDLLAMFHEPALLSELHRQDIAPTPEPTADGVSSGRLNSTDQIEGGSGERESRYREINLKLDMLTKQDGEYRVKPRRMPSDDEGFRGRRFSPVRSRTRGEPPDESPPLAIKGTEHPPKGPIQKLSLIDDSERVSPSQGKADEAQIVAISPNGDREWEEINMDGIPYLVHRDTVDELPDDFGSLHRLRRGKGVERWRRNHEQLDHVDSGLGDMEFSTLVAGVGEHTNVYSDTISDVTKIPEGIGDDLGADYLDNGGIKASEGNRLSSPIRKNAENEDQLVSGELSAQGPTGSEISPGDLPLDVKSSAEVRTESPIKAQGPAEQLPKDSMMTGKLSDSKTQQCIDDNDPRQGNTDDLRIENDNDHRETG